MILSDIYILLGVCLGLWYLYHLRNIAEHARKQAQQHCEQLNLQFIAIARVKTRLRFNPRLGPHLRSQFQVEFSSDGESAYQGQLLMLGLKLESFDLPVYKI
ncbi:DUF3301 domain-containing protein [Thalassotalea aquiviva]|uniref:DUF3301 domain-containing protein n=1 Tax=Thalassotalea aquiviva TaxID=3242415 RepID=UPI00352A743F